MGIDRLRTCTKVAISNNIGGVNQMANDERVEVARQSLHFALFKQILFYSILFSCEPDCECDAARDGVCK